MLRTSFGYLYVPVPILPNLLLVVLYSPGSFWYSLSVLLLRVCLCLDAYISFQLYMLCISCRLCTSKLLAYIWADPDSLGFLVVGMWFLELESLECFRHPPGIIIFITIIKRYLLVRKGSDLHELAYIFWGSQWRKFHSTAPTIHAFRHQYSCHVQIEVQHLKTSLCCSQY